MKKILLAVISTLLLLPIGFFADTSLLDYHANEIEREYEEIYKQVDRFKMTNFGNNGEKLFELLDKMKSLAADYYAENKRVNNLTVEEAVREVLHSD